MIEEPNASKAPLIRESASFFVDLSARTWMRARRESQSAKCVVVESDPFKGLWYNWIYEMEGWPALAETVPLYHDRIEAGELGLPDLYVLLLARDDQLRERRHMDRTRKRRNFEKHLRLIQPQREYFAAAAKTGLVDVLEVDTSDRESATARVVSRLQNPFRGSGSAVEFVQSMSTWIQGQRTEHL